MAAARAGAKTAIIEKQCLLGGLATSGGYIGINNFGFDYVKALAENFFGIEDISFYAAEGLDIFGTDVETVMQRAKIEIESDTQKL